MTIRERIAAYKAAVGPTASDVLRYPLSDVEGATLAAEIGPSKCRHAARVDAWLGRLAEAIDAADKAAPLGLDALIPAALKVKTAADGFWDAFEGEEVEGVTIIRRRA